MDSTKKRITVAMIDGSFREKFHAFESFAKQDFESFEVLWVEYYDDVADEIKRVADEYPSARYITLGRTGEYHSSYCFNAGITEGTGELMVIPDADVIVSPDFLSNVWEEHQKYDQLAMYVYRWDEPKDRHEETVSPEHLERVCRLSNPQNYGGCLTVRRKWLLAVNGYEMHSWFGSGFHANGKDMYTRFKNIGLAVKWHPELKLLHPWHPATLEPAPNYVPQHVIIDDRFRNFMSMAYVGIDPSKNVPFPDELEKKIRQAVENKAQQQPGKPAPQSPASESPSLVKRAVNRIKRLIG